MQPQVYASILQFQFFPIGIKIQKLSVINSYLKASRLYLHQGPSMYRETIADIDLANIYLYW